MQCMYIMEIEKIHSIFATDMNTAERTLCLKLFSINYFIIPIRSNDFFDIWRILSRNHPRMICTKYNREVKHGNYWMYVEESNNLKKLKRRLHRLDITKIMNDKNTYRSGYKENIEKTTAFLQHAVELALGSNLGIIYFTDKNDNIR